MPYMKVKNGDQICVHKKMEDGSAGEKMGCHDSEAEADAQIAAIMAQENMQSPGFMQTVINGVVSRLSKILNLQARQISDFSFTELADDAKWIDGMAVGKFTAMDGQEVEFKEKDFPKYVEHTKALIETTKTENGEVVGLPIDLDKHDHAGGAGWITDVELDAARKLVRFAVKWTKEGVSVIKDNIRRFFSPTLDPEQKVVLGGSLTNWPATREENWHFQLRPIELSQSIKEIDMSKSLEELEKLITKQSADIALLQKGEKPGDGKLELGPDGKPIAKPAELVLSKELLELLNTPDGVTEIARRTNMRVEQAIALEKRVKSTTDFAAKLVTGSAAHPYGAPISAAELVATLLSLPEKQAAAVQLMMEKMWNQVIDFAERGYGLGNTLAGKPLPKEYHELAMNFVKAGHSIGEFLEANKDVLGDPQQFNLAPYILKKKEDVAV